MSARAECRPAQVDIQQMATRAVSADTADLAADRATNCMTSPPPGLNYLLHYASSCQTPLGVVTDGRGSIFGVRAGVSKCFIAGTCFLSHITRFLQREI